MKTHTRVPAAGQLIGCCFAPCFDLWQPARMLHFRFSASLVSVQVEKEAILVLARMAKQRER